MKRLSAYYEQEAVELSDTVYNAILPAESEKVVPIPVGTRFIGFVADDKFFAGFGIVPISIPTVSGTPNPIAYNSPTLIPVWSLGVSTLRLISETEQLIQVHFYR